MINIFHLFWICPISALIGLWTACACVAAKRGDNDE